MMGLSWDLGIRPSGYHQLNPFQDRLSQRRLHTITHTKPKRAKKKDPLFISLSLSLFDDPLNRSSRDRIELTVLLLQASFQLLHGGQRVEEERQVSLRALDLQGQETVAQL